MPVKPPGSQDARMCWIVGEFDTDRTTIRHVGLLAQDGPITHANADVDVWHMAPPLVGPPAPGSTMPCHLLGWLEDLDEENLLLIEQEARLMVEGGGWIGQYIVFPAIQLSERKEDKGGKSMPLRSRFSCAGFVAHCYDRGKKTLVDLERLPPVHAHQLLQIWPDRKDRFMTEGRRNSVGLKEGGPWPVLLPSYLLHAIDACEKRKAPLPYAPVDEDWQYR
ncbi:MAG TPA: hypothetical protein PK156_41075 [Polyangium sp.]|nr:hypothetical protein [Polyangium sp.]